MHARTELRRAARPGRRHCRTWKLMSLAHPCLFQKDTSPPYLATEENQRNLLLSNVVFGSLRLPSESGAPLPIQSKLRGGFPQEPHGNSPSWKSRGDCSFLIRRQGKRR